MGENVWSVIKGDIVRCGSAIIPLYFRRRCRVLGIDPSGGRGSWGFALLLPSEPYRWVIGEVLEARPTEALTALSSMLSKGVCLIGIDAPIGGFGSTAYRSVDRAARSLGARILPLWRGMRALAVTGTILASMLIESGFIVIETHPFSVAVMTGLDVDALRTLYGRHGGDSLLASIAAAAFVDNVSITLCQRDGSLTLPATKAELYDRELRLLSFKGSI